MFQILNLFCSYEEQGPHMQRSQTNLNVLGALQTLQLYKSF